MIRRRDAKSPSDDAAVSEAGTHAEQRATNSDGPIPEKTRPDPVMEQSVLKVDDDVLFWERAVPTDRGEPPSQRAREPGTDSSLMDTGDDSPQALRRWVRVVQEQLGDLPKVLEEHMAAVRSPEDRPDGRIEARLSDLEDGISALRALLDTRLAELTGRLAETSADVERRIDASLGAVEQRVREVASSELEGHLAEARRVTDEHDRALDDRIKRVEQARSDLAESLEATLAKTAEEVDARFLENSARLGARLERIERRMEDLALAVERRLGAFGVRIQSVTKLFAQVARALDSNLQVDDVSEPRSPSTSEPSRRGPESPQAFEG